MTVQLELQTLDLKIREAKQSLQELLDAKPAWSNEMVDLADKYCDNLLSEKELILELEKLKGKIREEEAASVSLAKEIIDLKSKLEPSFATIAKLTQYFVENELLTFMSTPLRPEEVGQAPNMKKMEEEEIDHLRKQLSFAKVTAAEITLKIEQKEATFRKIESDLLEHNEQKKALAIKIEGTRNRTIQHYAKYEEAHANETIMREKKEGFIQRLNHIKAGPFPEKSQIKLLKLEKEIGKLTPICSEPTPTQLEKWDSMDQKLTELEKIAKQHHADLDAEAKKLQAKAEKENTMKNHLIKVREYIKNHDWQITTKGTFDEATQKYYPEGVFKVLQLLVDIEKKEIQPLVNDTLNSARNSSQKYSHCLGFFTRWLRTADTTSFYTLLEEGKFEQIYRPKR